MESRKEGWIKSKYRRIRGDMMKQGGAAKKGIRKAREVDRKKFCEKLEESEKGTVFKVAK